MYHKITKVALIYVIMLTANCQAAYKMRGDGINPETTFSFSPTLCASAAQEGLFFVASPEDSPNNSYTLAVTHRKEKKFVPLGPAQIILDKKEKQHNPLHGAGVRFFALNPGALVPAVVTHKDPTKIYLIKSYAISTDFQSDFSNQLQKDPSLVEITSFDAADPVAGLTLTDKGVFVATHPKEGRFGQPGSTLAALGVIRPAELGSKDQKKKQITDQYEKISTPFDASHPAVSIKNPAQNFLNKDTKLHWAPHLSRVYIPLQVKTGLEAESGARGIVVGSVAESTIELFPVAPDTAFDEHSLLGVKGPDKTIAISEVKTMKTSTLLDYLLVAVDDGSRLFSFPVVTAIPTKKQPATKEHGANSDHGTLAAQDALPVPFYNPATGLLHSRHFTKTAQKPSDIYTAHDKQAMIGGGSLPAPLTHCIVVGDAVFASTASKESKAPVGIFHSQAIFDVHGRIAGWTSWQRVAGANGEISGFALDSVTGSFWYAKNNGTVWATQWDSSTQEPQNNSAISKLFAQIFKNVPSGVQHLAAYSSDNHAFSQNTNEKMGLLVAAGYHKVALIQTGKDTGGVFTPATAFNTVVESNNGKIPDFAQPINVLTIQGGALRELGAVCASALVDDGSQAWLAVAGGDGVAVLATKRGQGWSTTTATTGSKSGLASGFKGLSSDMRFIKIASYKSIHKLLAYKDTLCAVTPFGIHVLKISSEAITNYSSGKQSMSHFIPIEKLTNHAHAVITDALIENDCMLIGTNTGLLVLPVDGIVNYPTSAAQHIRLPHMTGGMVRFYLVPAHDSNLSNIYLIDGSPSHDQARVYRLAWHDKTIGLLPDWYSIGNPRPSYWYTIGVYRGFMATDGATLMLTGSVFGHRKASIEAIGAPFYSGDTTFAYRKHVIAYEPQGKTVGQVIRDPALGVWLAYGDFGVIAHT